MQTLEQSTGPVSQDDPGFTSFRFLDPRASLAFAGVNPDHSWLRSNCVHRVSTILKTTFLHVAKHDWAS